MGLTIVEGKLFWQPYSHLKGLNKRNSFFLCSIGQKSCQNQDPETLPIYFENPTTFKGNVNFSLSNQANNPCEMNGNCSDLCLRTSNNRRACACHLGYELDMDSKSCASVTDYLVYVENDFIRAISVDSKSTFKDVILPTFITTEFSVQKSIISFDYDALNDNFIFTDGRGVYTVKIMHDSLQKMIIKPYNSDYYIEDLALDQFSNNLYYIEEYQPYYNYECNYHLVVVSNINLEEKYTKQLKIMRSAGKAHQLSINPGLGSIVYMETLQPSSQKIHMISIDGSIVKNSHWSEKILTSSVSALDRNENKLYFTDLNEPDFLNYTSWDDENKIFVGPLVPVINVTSFSVNDNYIFFSNFTNI